MTLSSIDEAKGQLIANGSYAGHSGSVAVEMVRRYIEAAEYLILHLPRSTRHGSQGLDLNPDAIERMLKRAYDWYVSVADNGDSGTTRADLSEFRQ